MQNASNTTVSNLCERISLRTVNNALSVVNPRARVLLHDDVSNTLRSESVRTYRHYSFYWSFLSPSGFKQPVQSFYLCSKHRWNWMLRIVCGTVTYWPSWTTLKVPLHSCDVIVEWRKRKKARSHLRQVGRVRKDTYIFRGQNFCTGNAVSAGVLSWRINQSWFAIV